MNKKRGCKEVRGPFKVVVLNNTQSQMTRGKSCGFW
jgi:hypothetical protein